MLHDVGPEPEDLVEDSACHCQRHPHQSENWLFDDRYYWTKARRLKWKQLVELDDAPSKLWINGQHTAHGHNDRIDLDRAQVLTDSLRLIRVPNLVIHAFRPGAKYGSNKRRLQGKFKYLGTTYQLMLTDPLVEKKFLALADGEYTLPTSYLAISLGEPYHDNVYKLIAAVMTVPGGEIANGD